jgi:cytoskeletal protein RodZ
MFKTFRDKIALSGIAVLIVGIILLVFTFVSAYVFLTQSLSIIATEDLAQTFGESLAPLIATCIRIMYLGVMGWTGSLITIRGVTIIAHTPNTETPSQQKTVEIKKELPPPQELKTKKPKKETKKPEVEKTEVTQAEPEIIVIPPEEVAQTQSELEPATSKEETDQSSE